MAEGSSATSGNDTSTSSQSMDITDSLIKTVISPHSNLIIAHLEDDNYLLWKVQVETAARGYGLDGYILGMIATPPKFITNQDNKTVSNEEYVKFVRQDSLISSWLLSSISVKLLPQVIGCKSANEIWTTVERIFNTQSAAKIMHYKRQLHNIRKDSQSMKEYLYKIKNTCDLLEAAGHKMSNTEHVLTILSGLGDEYEAVVAVISSQKTLPTIDYVHSILLAHEGRLDYKKPSDTDMSVNYASNNKNRNQNYGRSDQQS